MTDLPKQSDDPVPSFKYDPPIVWYKYYGWKVVFLGSFILAIINGPLVSGGGTFFVALERQYKWSRTVLFVENKKMWGPNAAKTPEFFISFLVPEDTFLL